VRRRAVVPVMSQFEEEDEATRGRSRLWV